MRTFLAFKYHEEITDSEIDAALSRVKNHYYNPENLNLELNTRGVSNKTIGAYVIDLKETSLKWPSIYEEKGDYLITYSPPSNWKEYSKTGVIENGPKELLSHILGNKYEDNIFSAPTCFAVFSNDKSEMNIYTDSIGFTRLYEYHGEKGVFWSNRPGVLPLLANEKAEMSKDGWSSLAAIGWFGSNSSPIEGVTRIDPGIAIQAHAKLDKPRNQIDYGAFNSLISYRPQSSLNYKEIAENMRNTLDSYQDLWDVPYTVDLSGGKDSRICAATAISAGIENITFRTIANYDDELEVAKSLLNKVNQTHNHMIINPLSQIDEKEKILRKKPIKDRMKLYFLNTDGDCTPAVVQNNVTEKMIYSKTKKIKVAGVLGNIAKPFYLNSYKQVEKFSKLKNDAAFEKLKLSLFKYEAVSENANKRAIGLVKSQLQKGKGMGINGTKLLDYFSLVDYGRRWPPQGNLIDSFSIFYSNELIKQSMNMTTEERMEYKFFTGVTKYLVPEWENQEYFKLSIEKDERSNKKMRLWQTSDKDDIEGILKRPKLWNEYFDENKLKQLWENAKIDNLGIYTNAIEKLFYRVIMIAHFEEYLEDLNSGIS